MSRASAKLSTGCLPGAINDARIARSIATKAGTVGSESFRITTCHGRSATRVATVGAFVCAVAGACGASLTSQASATANDSANLQRRWTCGGCDASTRNRGTPVDAVERSPNHPVDDGVWPSYAFRQRVTLHPLPGNSVSASPGESDSSESDCEQRDRRGFGLPLT